MRKVIVLKDVAYADNKAGSGANTALTPYDLAEGAIGVYGIDPISANNANKQALITDAGSDAAGKVPDASFVGDHVVVAVGTATGCQVSNPIPVPSNGLVTYKDSAYAAPVYQVFGIGVVADPLGVAATVSGGLNEQATILAYDAAELKIIDTENKDQGGAIYPIKKNYNIAATIDSEGSYSLLSRLVNLIEADTKGVVAASLSTAASGTAFALSATVAAVKGATSLTTSAAHSVDVGDYVSLNGMLFQAVTGTATTTLVIDRPWPFANATIANAKALDLGATVPTSLGITLKSEVRGKNFSLATGEGTIYANAVQTQLIAGTKGMGVAEDVQEAENEARGLKGTADFINRYMPLDTLKAVIGTTYSQLDFAYQTRDQFGTGGTAKTAHKLFNELKLAFVSADSNGSLAEVKDILGVLLYGADIA